MKHVCTLILALFCAFPLRALEPAQGPVLLTVTGAISVTNAEGRADFDRAMLESLDWQEVTTYSEFFTGPERLAGPTLSSLLRALGATGRSMQAHAVDDYMIEIPVSDADRYDVIVALDRGGEPMRIRNKGPIWLIYPTSDPNGPGELHSSRMVWQLIHLHVVP